MPVENKTPEAAYATKDNIVHPGSVSQAQAVAEAAADALSAQNENVEVSVSQVPVTAEAAAAAPDQGSEDAVVTDEGATTPVVEAESDSSDSE